MQITTILMGLFFLFWIQAFVRGGWNAERTRYSHRRDLRLTSFTLVVMAVTAVLGAWGSARAGYTLWILAGMTVIHIGDLITGELIRVRHPYLVATGIFGLGHLFYLAALVNGAGMAGTSIPAWGPLLGLGAGFAVWLVLRSSHRKSLVYPALAYALLLCGITGAGVGLAVAAPVLWPLSVGLVLFSISDLLLGLRELKNLKFFLMYDVIWFFYIVGQLFIVWSAASGV